MKFIVGGERYDLTPEQVVRAVAKAEPEPLREHLVEIAGRKFPPKQAFGAVSGRPRQTFTTMEAQRILTRLGFECRRVGPSDADHSGAVASTEANSATLASLEAQVTTLMAAVAGLTTRITALEKDLH